MDFMIYIYAALAFVIAGGSGFICFHAGHRIGRREGYRYGYLKADAARLDRAVKAWKDSQADRSRTRLSDAIDRHLERMDSDE